MLDHRLLQQSPDFVIERLTLRGFDAKLIEELKGLVDQRKKAVSHLESLRHRLNQASEQVQEKVKEGNTAAVAAMRESLKELKQHIKEAEQVEQSVQQALDQALLWVPNLPHESVPVGADEKDNKVTCVVGEPKKYAFKPKNHWELAESLGIVDFEQAAKLSGARFAVYRGLGARLERALINFMLDCAREHGFTEIIPPLLVWPETMQSAGQFPKFKGDSFETLNGEHVLIPTSEVALVNLHKEEILEESQLPLRYTAYTPCFRREAGAAGRDTRGLIRQHQFNKVELVSYTKPEESYAELERLTLCARSVLDRLQLPYRVMALCTADMGFCASKTYDLEVWLPGQDCYREISSCSNCEDFQARRSRTRFRGAASEDAKKSKTQLVHTLNGSGIAVGRAFVAVLENYQTAEGAVHIPEALIPYTGFSVIPCA
jgi:seryl-tRNA synthetase